MAEKESPNPNIFFIIGAPTSLTLQKFNEFISKNNNVKLVICADMPTYIKALESGNVFKTPTNFRAHADDQRTFHTASGDITTNSVENFRQLQSDIATSLFDIFSTAQVKGIPTYFGIVPRKKRPLLLVNKKKDPDANGQIISTPEEDRAVGAHAHNYSHPYVMDGVDVALTEKIRDKLLIPNVYGSAENLYKVINNKEISKYGATFLSDMITVGCAGLLDIPALWESYVMNIPNPENKTKEAIYRGNRHSLYGDVPVVQENITFSSGAGNFYGYKDTAESIGRLKSIMHRMIDDDRLKLFGNCYVWHDDELNDLDDLPAIGLIEKLSVKVVKEKNYSTFSDPFAVKGDGTKGYMSFGGSKKRRKKRKRTKKRTHKKRRKRKTKKRRKRGGRRKRKKRKTRKN